MTVSHSVTNLKLKNSEKRFFLQARNIVVLYGFFKNLHTLKQGNQKNTCCYKSTKLNF